MQSILILAATDRPENRLESAVQSQLADAEMVAARLHSQKFSNITLCLPTVDDVSHIIHRQHPTLAQLAVTNAMVDLSRFDAMVVIPPDDGSSPPLHPFVAQSINHFMENRKFIALCRRTTMALRWLLPSGVLGMHKCDNVSSDSTLCEALNSYFVGDSGG